MGYLNSSIGKKQLMAVTGLVWCGFVLTHMLGNLLIFLGADAYNWYAHTLTANPFIYLAEALLAFTILVHVVDGLRVTVQNRAARQVKYAMVASGKKAPRFQSKFMAFHGMAILVFLILHLLTFKYGTAYTTVVRGHEVRDLYKLVVEVFHQPFYVVGYLFCMVLVGLHLSHGFYSAFATLGVFHPKHSPVIDKIGYLYGVIVALGFISQPLYVYLFAL